jgi:acetyltransferase-like isoleucine patch superfamily enzyme
MSFKIGKDCKIHPSVQINVNNGFIGDRSIINEGVRLEGSHIEIGAEAFLDANSSIGGGSCFDAEAFFKARDFLHMGINSHINIARGVSVGYEFGCGVDTKIFTHGAYIDSYGLGAPVQWGSVSIGDNVWMPNAWVNPGVSIGSNVIVAARSLVNESIPSNSLAGGTPAKVIRENYLPRLLSEQQKNKLVHSIFSQIRQRNDFQIDNFDTEFDSSSEVLTVICQNEVTVFDLRNRTIEGAASSGAIVTKDQLRRNGIRFRFFVNSGRWENWTGL